MPVITVRMDNTLHTGVKALARRQQQSMNKTAVMVLYSAVQCDPVARDMMERREQQEKEQAARAEAKSKAKSR